MLKTRSYWPSVAISAGMPSTACASTPRACSAASTLPPEFSETSRSALAPPISTATRPNSRALVILRLISSLR